MALIEEALASRLSDCSGLTDLVGSAIFPVQISQKDPSDPLEVPAVVFELIGDPQDHSHEGVSMANPRYQVTTWATTYTQAKRVADQVRLCLQGFKGTVSVESYSPVETVKIFSTLLDTQRDLYDGDTKLYGVAQDYFVKHQTTRP